MKYAIILLTFLVALSDQQIIETQSLFLVPSQFYVLSVAPLTKQQVRLDNYTVKGKYFYEWIVKPSWAQIEVGSIFGNVSTSLTSQVLRMKYSDDKNNSNQLEFTVNYNNKTPNQTTTPNISYLVGATTSRVYTPNKDTILILVEPIVDPCDYHIQQLQTVNTSLIKLQAYFKSLKSQEQVLLKSKNDLNKLNQNMTADYKNLSQQLKSTNSLIQKGQAEISDTYLKLQNTVQQLENTTVTQSEAMILLVTQSENNLTQLQSQIATLNTNLSNLASRYDLINKDLNNIQLNLINLNLRSNTLGPQQLYQSITFLNNNRAESQITRQQLYHQIITVNNTINAKQLLIHGIQGQLKKQIDSLSKSIDDLESTEEQLAQKLSKLIINNMALENKKAQLQNNITDCISGLVNVNVQFNMTDVYIRSVKRLTESSRAQIKRDQQALNHINTLIKSCRASKSPVITYNFSQKFYNASNEERLRLSFEKIVKQPIFRIPEYSIVFQSV